MRNSIIYLFLFLSLIPLASAQFANESFIVKVYADGEFKGFRLVSIAQTAQEVFGDDGAVLAFVIFVSLAGMAVTSGSSIGVIVFGLIGLITSIAINVLNTGSIIGIGSSVIFILCAAAILIYKMKESNVQ